MMELHRGFQSLARRLLPQWILRRLDPFQAAIDGLLLQAGGEVEAGMIVLDAGAGESQHKRYFPRACYVALDRCIGDPRWDYGSVDVRGDLMRIPLTAAAVDRILCVVTLEHLEDPAKAIAEFARVLKPGGKLYLVTPLMWEEHQVPHDYFRFTRWGLSSLLQRSGLETLQVEPVGGFFWVFGRRCVNLVAFFQTSWRWIFFPAAALLSGSVALLCYYLDPLDRNRNHTLGHIAVAALPKKG